MDTQTTVKGIVVFVLIFGAFVLAKPNSHPIHQAQAPSSESASHSPLASEEVVVTPNDSERKPTETATPEVPQSQSGSSATASLNDTSQEAIPSEISMTLGVSGNDRPVLILKTNLPPKAILMVTVANPINKGGDGYFAQQQGRVEDDQTIRIGPFTKSGGGLSVGKYQVTVQTIMATLQPPEVQPFFGFHGENLTGPQIALLPGTSERSFVTTFDIVINPDEVQDTAAPIERQH